MTTMTQCELRAKDGRKMVSWIETRGATIGKWVEVKEQNKELFEVLNTYDTLPSEVVYENERNFKTHRQATDI